MKTAIIYTVLSLINLIAFVAGVAALPAEVPVHFNASMAADGIGSPWVYLALPGAAALVSIGLWTVLTQKKNRAVLTGLLAALGGALATIGWAFFALAASGVGVGEKTTFPIALVVGFPISLVIAGLGNYMPRIEPNRILGIRTNATLKSEEVWRKTHRLGGALFFAAGLLSAVGAVLFGCIPALLPLQYVSLSVMVGTLLIAATVSVIYAQVLYKREKTAKDGRQ